MKLILSAIVFIIPILCFSSENPDWVKALPKADSTHKYYIGRSSFAASEAIGISQATKDAYEQAHRENFGSTVKINSETYESTSTVSSITRVSEKSRAARFEDFEQQDVFIESVDNNRFNVWVLYRFSIAAIKNEQFRLKNIKPDKDDVVLFSTQGGATDLSKGTLELVTHPSGAVVYIDGERFGKTPLKLVGQLDTGEHQIRFDHPRHELIEEKLIVIPNKTLRVEKTLVVATGNIKIQTIPSYANVILNGQPIGLSPIDDIKVEAGVPIKIEISHAETEKVTREIIVEKGITRSLQLELPLKPSYFSLETIPTGATLQFNGRVYSTPIRKAELEPGSYSFRIQKDGFLTQEVTFSLRGGENKPLPTVTLVPFSVEQKRLATNPWKIELGVGLHGSSIQENNSGAYSLNISGEKKFVGFIGVKLVYELAHSGSQKEYPPLATPNSQIKNFEKMDSNELSVGLPIYFYKALYFCPESGVSKSSVSVKTINYDSSGVSDNNNNNATKSYDFNQIFSGAYIGYESITAEKSDGWFVNVGFRKYSDTESFKGSTPYLLRLGLLTSF